MSKKYSDLIALHESIKEQDLEFNLNLPSMNATDLLNEIENYLKILLNNSNYRSNTELKKFIPTTSLIEKKKTSPRGDKKHFTHSLIIKKSTKECMEVIKDYENYTSTIKHLLSAKIIKNVEPGVTDVEYCYKASLVKFSYTLRHTVDENCIMWTCINGFIKNSVGSWIFEPLGKE
jgi:hypothetical protein